MTGEIINRVAQSGIITIDLEDLYPKGERVLYDLKSNLYEGLILKEKDLREFIKIKDWTEYNGKYVAITCSSDALIPTWAYMLISSKIAPIATRVIAGDLQDLELVLFLEAIKQINPEDYRDARVVIKGCSKVAVPASAYIELTNMLLPFVSSLMFGEPCSTVPVYKKPKNS